MPNVLLPAISVDLARELVRESHLDLATEGGRRRGGAPKAGPRRRLGKAGAAIEVNSVDETRPARCRKRQIESRHRTRMSMGPSVGIPRASLVVDPGGDVGGVEADEAPDFEVGDAAFGDEAADVARAGPEMLCELVDGDEGGYRLGQRMLLLGSSRWTSPRTPYRRPFATWARDKKSQRTPLPPTSPVRRLPPMGRGGHDLRR